MSEELEVPYVLPDGRPLATLKQEDVQVFMYGFEAAEMQQVVTAARAIHEMISNLVTTRGKIKNDARKAKIIPANADAEKRNQMHDELEQLYARFNEAGELAEELKSVVFTKVNGQLKLPNILALSRKVQKLAG